jgi:phosphoglycerate dehydrogenase-like enzyme
MSLYRNFPSKDDLVVECLKNEDREFFEWWDEVIAPYSDDPRAQISALFTAFETHACCESGSRGCALANAAVELPDLEHPARAVVLEHHRKIRSRLRDLCHKIGARDPQMLGDSLMLLMGGSYMARLIFPTTGAIESVSEAARILIESSQGTEEFTLVSLEKLFRQSDFISLHVPLTPETEGMVNRERLQQMKSSAFLINTSRGPLINESDLRWALEHQEIAGAGLDVLSSEPPPADHPLIGAPNCIITPHQAWASFEARNRLMGETVRNVQAFVQGEQRNVVV